MQIVRMVRKPQGKRPFLPFHRTIPLNCQHQPSFLVASARWLLAGPSGALVRPLPPAPYAAATDQFCSQATVAPDTLHGVTDVHKKRSAQKPSDSNGLAAYEDYEMVQTRRISGQKAKGLTIQHRN